MLFYLYFHELQVVCVQKKFFYLQVYFNLTRKIMMMSSINCACYVLSTVHLNFLKPQETGGIIRPFFTNVDTEAERFGNLPGSQNK